MCAGGLRGVGVLLEPGPGEVGQRPMVPDHVRDLPDRIGVDARNCRGMVGRVCAAQRGEVFERGTTGDRAVTRRDRAGAAQGEPDRRLGVGARRGVVADLGATPFVPGHEAVAVFATQQRPIVVAHQERTIGPVAHEVAVEPAVLDHHRGNGQRDRSVRPWPHRQPVVGLDRQSDPARIHDDQLCTARTRLGDGTRGGEPRRARIEAPEQDAAGALIVRHADPRTGGEGAGEFPVPGADLSAVAGVRRSEAVDQPIDPGHRVGDRRGRRRRDGKGHRLRTVFGGDPPQRRCGLVQRLVPTDAPPARIGIALRPRTAQRKQQAVARVDHFRSSAALCAQRLAGRMRRIGFERHEATVLDHRLASAARDAERTVRGNAAGVVRHGIDLSSGGMLGHGIGPMLHAQRRGECHDIAVRLVGSLRATLRHAAVAAIR